MLPALCTAAVFLYIAPRCNGASIIKLTEAELDLRGERKVDAQEVQLRFEDTPVTQKWPFLRYARYSSHASNAEMRVFALRACPPRRRSGHIMSQVIQPASQVRKTRPNLRRHMHYMAVFRRRFPTKTRTCNKRHRDLQQKTPGPATLFALTCDVP